MRVVYARTFIFFSNAISRYTKNFFFSRNKIQHCESLLKIEKFMEFLIITDLFSYCLIYNL